MTARSDLKGFLRRAAGRIPYLSALIAQRDRLRADVRALREENRGLRKESTRAAKTLADTKTWVPPGHFYSPIPDRDEVSSRRGKIFDRTVRELRGIDLNESGQLAMLERLVEFYPDMPFAAEPRDGLRYHFENPNFGYGDATVLYCMLRAWQPKRVIEVGSGYSSCVMLDTNDRFFGGAISCVFIEPAPQLLRSLLRSDDEREHAIIAEPIQNVDPAIFEDLEAGDFLFLDSTHVSKTGSDVNHLLFEVLPRLKPGVVVHVHDIIYPFEYPEEWVMEGRAWNEAYLVRAFLQYNRSFQIVFFNSYLGQFHADRLNRDMPLVMKNPGGSLWMQRVEP